MNNPSAKITINNDHGLARTPLKGGRFRPEIALQRLGRARRQTINNSKNAITQTNMMAIQRFSDTTMSSKFKELEICRSTTELGLRNTM